MAKRDRSFRHQMAFDLAPAAVIPEPVEVRPGVLDPGPVVDALTASTGGKTRHGRLCGEDDRHAQQSLSEWHSGIVHCDKVVLGRVGGWKRARR